MGRVKPSVDNILPGTPVGKDVTCLDIVYFNPYQRFHKRPELQEFKGLKDAVFIIYKDQFNKKKIQVLPEPEIDIFFTKEPYRDYRTIREYIEEDKCYSVRCRPNKVIQTIEKEMAKVDDPITTMFKQTQDQTKQMLNQLSGADWKTLRPIRTRLKNALRWPYTLFSDLDVESYYRIMMGYRYNQMRSHIIDKAFLDIESAVYGKTETEQKNNEDPTNACTIIFDFDKNGPRAHIKPQVYTYLLRDYEQYPQQEYFENHLDDFIKTCHKEFDHQTVKKDGKVKVIDTVADYHIVLFNDERDLLKQIFHTINTISPDTCEIWNIAYDIPKLYHRIINNGMNPYEIMCSPEWDYRYRYIDIDIDNRPIDVAERKTSIRISSGTLYIDQMQNYCGIRKGRKAFGSPALDNIAKIELGMGKREFGKGIDVINAPIMDYWNFVLYNIRDVWAQTLVSRVTNDSMAAIYDMNQAFCPMKSLFKQVTYQRQIYYTQRLKRGFISGNNRNIDYLRDESEELAERKELERRAATIRRKLDRLIQDGIIDADDDLDLENLNDIIEDTEDMDENDAADKNTADITDIYKDSISNKIKLQGGVVGNPNQNIENGVELTSGVFSKHVQDDVMDMDYASEYPWAKYTRSMSMSTQYGRLIIGEKISDRQYVLPLGMEKRFSDRKYYMPGAEFVSDYLSGDIISFGNTWFNLPTVDELNKRILASGGLTK